MKPWLYKNKIVSANNLVCKDTQCPCIGEVPIPAYFCYFPMCEGLEDVLPLNSANYSNWPYKVTHDDYDIYTKTWEKLPRFECGEYSTLRTVYYFAFNDYFYGTSGGILGMYFGAISVTQIWASHPTLKYFFMLQTSSGYTTRDDRELTIRFKNLPSDTAFWDLSGSAFAVKNEYVYEYDVYEDEDYLASYKIQIGFSSAAWNHTDVETGYHCKADYYAIPEYPFTREKYIRFSIRIYNGDDEIVWEFTQSYQIPAVYSLGCIQDIDYCVMGSCLFSNQDCGGCLVSSRIFITSEKTALGLAGDCRRRSSLTYGMMSKSYRIIECGFDTQADANDYIDMNPGLEQSLQASCAGKPWVIVGYCECDLEDIECENCKEGGSLSVVCSEDVKPCNNGKRTVVLSSGYSTSEEAYAYLNENYKDLTEGIENECPPGFETTITINGIADCGCSKRNQEPPGMSVDLPYSGNYQIEYISGAIRTNSGTKWNVLWGASCGGCYAQYCWAPFSDAGPLQGFNGSGWNTAMEASEANAGSIITQYFETGSHKFWYEDNGCPDNQGSVTYKITYIG